MSLPKIYKSPKGYQFYFWNGKKVYIHRRVAEKKYGELPKGFIVHHIDGNIENNCRNNLMLLHRKDHFRLHAIKNIMINSK
jgi:hypothetical protein